MDESLDSLTVVEALRAAGVTVERLTDHFLKGTADQTWLAHAGNNGWVVLTRDKRIRYRQLERFALNKARISIDKWVRRKLRCYLWKQWGPSGYRELRKRGVSVREAWNTSKSAHGPLLKDAVSDYFSNERTASEKMVC